MANFVRVTQHLVNLDNIDEVVEGGEGLSKVHMVSGRIIPLSAEEHTQLTSQMRALWPNIGGEVIDAPARTAGELGNDGAVGTDGDDLTLPAETVE